MRRPKLKSGCCGAIGVFKCKKALAKLASAAYSLGMFSRTIRAFLFASLVALEIGGGLCPAQEDPRQLPFAPAIRYHFGDDADGKQGWAASQFDDSAWMVAQYGRWAVPAFSSDGFLWVRARVPVQAGLNEPLALRITGDSYHMLTNEVFVNGVKLADSGRLSTRSDALFDLPPALITVPSIAIVVLRIQYDPYIRKNVRVTGMRFSINESRVLLLEQRAHRARILVGQAPYLTVYLIIVLLGIGLLGVLEAKRRRGNLTLQSLADFWFCFRPLHRTARQRPSSAALACVPDPAPSDATNRIHHQCRISLGNSPPALQGSEAPLVRADRDVQHQLADRAAVHQAHRSEFLCSTVHNSVWVCSKRAEPRVKFLGIVGDEEKSAHCCHFDS